MTLGVFACMVAGAAFAAKPTPLIVGNPANCKNATYPTISAAVAVAAPGDTIKVCAGIYHEQVNVDKPLTFLGAQSGRDGRKGRDDAAKESVVYMETGADFMLQPPADNVTIDGFTLTSGGPMSANNGINAFQGTSGLVVINNMIKGNCNGINFQNPDASLPALIRHNEISNNTASSATLGPQCGTGVFISNGPANNTTISENSFSGHNTEQTAINFAGSPSGNPSTGLSVIQNDSVDDSTFVVATNSSGALISHNNVVVKTPSTSQGTAILDFGSNIDLSIEDNAIDGGSNDGTSGINIRAFSGTPSTNTRATNNKINNRYNGVRLTDGATGATVSNNHITRSSHDGIYLQNGTLNKILRNHVETSSVHDCEDPSVGTGTANTANAWTGNLGQSNNSLPAAICPK